MLKPMKDLNEQKSKHCTIKVWLVIVDIDKASGGYICVISVYLY